MTVRLLGVGAAAPSLRLSAGAVASAWGRGGGRGQVAVCAPDEDVLTLAWEAGTAALHAAGVAADRIDALFWGTSRPPFAEGPSHAFLAAALGCAPTAARRAVRGLAARRHGSTRRGRRRGRGRVRSFQSRDRV